MASESSSASAAVAARIREVRVELGMSQTDFARALGVSRSNIYEVEHNSVKITVDILFQISERFGGRSEKANAHYLLSGKHPLSIKATDQGGGMLNSVLGLDEHALIFALGMYERLGIGPATPATMGRKAGLFRQILYAYLGEMDRAKRDGVDIVVARRAAVRACMTLFGSLRATDLRQDAEDERHEADQEMDGPFPTA